MYYLTNRLNKDVTMVDGIETKRMTSVMLASNDDGVVIQRQLRTAFAGNHDWNVNNDPAWDWHHYDFRVKPTPREWWLNVYKDEFVFVHAHESREQARVCESGEFVECVHVREVLDD